MKLPIDMFTIPILFKASSSIVRDGILLKFDDDEVFSMHWSKHNSDKLKK